MKLTVSKKKFYFNTLITSFSVIVPLLIGMIIIYSIGINPVTAYKSLFFGAFGTLNGFAETITKASPLLLSAVAVAIAFRCSIWNIGAEGQLLFGAIATTWLGIYFIPMSRTFIIPIALIFSFIAGGVWGLVPGILKAKFNANEIISTIMFNFIAVLLVNYLVSGPWKTYKKYGINPMTDDICPSLHFPKLLPGTRLHFGIILGIVIAALAYFILFKTTFGYRIRAVGLNPKAAEFGGINVGKIMMYSMLVSGGIAGIAGMGEVAGIHYCLMDGISPGYGYTAVIVALLGKLHPIGIIFSSILFSALIVGADTMQQLAGVPISIIRVIQALVIIFVLVSEVFTRRRIKF